MQNTENKFKHDGLWYIAVEQYGCRNCAFNVKGNDCNNIQDELVACNFQNRSDNRDVIFVRSDVDNLGDEE
jgi:hypothetical protein